MNSSRKYLHPPHPCWEGVFLLWLPSSLDFPKSAHKIDPLPTGNSIYVAHLLLGIFRKRYRRRSLGIIHLELYLYLHQSSRNLRWYSNMATGSNATFHENDLYRKFNFIILKKKKKQLLKIVIHLTRNAERKEVYWCQSYFPTWIIHLFV